MSHLLLLKRRRATTTGCWLLTVTTSIVPEVLHAIVPKTAILQIPTCNFEDVVERLDLIRKYRFSSDELPQRLRLPIVTNTVRQRICGYQAVAGALDDALRVPSPGTQILQYTGEVLHTPEVPPDR